MSWKCKTHLEFNEIQPARLPCHSDDAFPGVATIILGGYRWRWCSADLSIQRDDNMVLGGVVRAQFGAQRKTTKDRAKRRLLWHGWCFLTSQMASVSSAKRLQSWTEKAATWRRNQFNVNHLSYNVGHTHTHTNKYAQTRSESKGWFQWQPEWRTQQDIWHIHRSSRAIILKQNRLFEYSCINCVYKHVYLSHWVWLVVDGRWSMVIF